MILDIILGLSTGIGLIVLAVGVSTLTIHLLTRVALGCVRRRLPYACTATRKQRRAWRRERLEVTP